MAEAKDTSMSVIPMRSTPGEKKQGKRHEACSNGEADMRLVERRSMDWIRRAAELRTLVGKRDELGYPLGPVESARLSELEHFFTACADPERAPYVQREQIRRPVRIVVTFITRPGSMVSGEARDVSGQGMYVACHEPLMLGEATVVRVIDRMSGDELRFAAEVVRVERGDRPGMGLRFVGIPVALRVGHRPPPPAPQRKAA
jgi:hypothetical protein